MDPYRLLARSTKLKKCSANSHRTPSSGPVTSTQIIPLEDRTKGARSTSSRKRKRGQEVPSDSIELDFFGPSAKASQTQAANGDDDIEENEEDAGISCDHAEQDPVASKHDELSLEERKSILRGNKLKINWINPPLTPEENRRSGTDSKKKTTAKVAIYPQCLRSFSELRTRFGISATLASNVAAQGYSIPTEVQMGAMPLLLDASSDLFAQASLPAQSGASGNDLLTVAPTGSGKTLAFMIPLVHEILRRRRERHEDMRRTSAIILAPTKELAGQIVNEGRKLAHGTGVKLTRVKKGMKLSAMHADNHTYVNGEKDVEAANGVKSDILVSTPGILASVLHEATEHSHPPLSGVRRLILDEADVLLDSLFRDQTLAVWNSLPREDLRVSLWSATMGSNIEELARTTIRSRQRRLRMEQDTPIYETPVIRLVVGLKDSAVPNVRHKLIYAASEQGKLMGLRELLHPSTSSSDARPPLVPPFLVFTQTIERAVALHSELLYDIPAEAGGISRISVLHSDLSDKDRDKVMTRFRKGEIWVLITTDLLSRGVDFRGVNGVVNYDIPTSSAAYIHRVGRTGRAGREGGVAFTLYTKEDIPYLKPIANLVATAHKLRGGSDGSGVDRWLLDALPTLSKQTKQGLKKHGIDARTARGKQADPKAARQARISTKAGFVRREENRRKGAILGSRKRRVADAGDDGEETEFGGFD